MLLPKFEHLKARRVEEAVSLLSEDTGAESLLMAGGTELLPRMKYGLATCRRLVSLRGAPARPPRRDSSGGLVLDSLTLLADLADDPLVGSEWPMIAEAAWEVASNQVRNMATLGGNLCQETRCLYFNQSHSHQFREPCFKRGGGLCHFAPKGKKCWAVFMSDLAPALLSLGATLAIAGPGGRRSAPLAELYTGDPLSPLGLERGELIAEVLVPPAGENRGWGYTKFALRGGTEFAAFNLAAVLELDASGASCRRARLTAGAVAGGPVAVDRVPAALEGQPLSGELIARAAESAASGLRPFPHHGYSGPYLRAVLQAEIEAVLALAAERAAAPR
jgi:4-hydroxybenzoyl-CoA reductase beta subunit